MAEIDIKTQQKKTETNKQGEKTELTPDKLKLTQAINTATAATVVAASAALVLPKIKEKVERDQHVAEFDRYFVDVSKKCGELEALGSQALISKTLFGKQATDSPSEKFEEAASMCKALGYAVSAGKSARDKIAHGDKSAKTRAQLEEAIALLAKASKTEVA